MGKVWFVDAGLGDSELLTLKGRNLIARAGAIFRLIWYCSPSITGVSSY